jgi:hypothetical protein
MTAEQAQTVLSQMGGTGKLSAMVGAKDFMRGNNPDGTPFVSFKFKGCERCNFVRITLAPDDTYTVSFGKIAGMKFLTGPVYEGTYADRLIPTFEQHTGLYLRF